MYTKRIPFPFRLLPIPVLCLTLFAPTHVLAQTPGYGKTLYQRLGGYDAIAAVVDDFIGRLASDEDLSKFFVGHSEASLHQIRQLIVDQLCNATGGPCLYLGRDMKTAHQGLHITDAQWDLSVNHLVATLDRFSVPEPERQELFKLLDTLKAEIVEQM